MATAAAVEVPHARRRGQAFGAGRTFQGDKAGGGVSNAGVSGSAGPSNRAGRRALFIFFVALSYGARGCVLRYSCLLFCLVVFCTNKSTLRRRTPVFVLFCFVILHQPINIGTPVFLFVFCTNETALCTVDVRRAASRLGRDSSGSSFTATDAGGCLFIVFFFVAMCACVQPKNVCGTSRSFF